MMKEMRLIEKIDDETEIKYWRFKMPMMSDRDNVLKIHMRDIDQDSTFFHL